MFLTKKIVQKNYTLSYRLYLGGGDKYLLLFHGFGQTISSFHELAEKLTSHYSVVSLGLFFHEENSYSDLASGVISVDTWSDIINMILTAEKISRFDMLGFSMGARLVVSALYRYGDCVDQVVLVAPDGILIDFWYKLAVYSRITRGLFYYLLFHSGFILKISRVLTYLKLTDDRIISFAFSQMQNEEQILRVYQSWVYLRKLKMSSRNFISVINGKPIKIKMIFGTRDRIVRFHSFKNIIKKTNAEIMLLPASHSQINQQLKNDEVVAFLTTNRK